MSDKPLRVVIADDHYIVREGTRQLLNSSDLVEVVATVGDPEALLRAVERDELDVAVVDIRMPPTNQTEGIQAARTIRASHPHVGVVVLSQYANALYAFELFADGTGGLAYLLKDRVGDLGELVRAVATVAAGGSVIDPAVVEGLLARGTTVTDTRLPALTDREFQVLHEMAQGKSNQAISGSLYLSQSAVEKHITAILGKLGLDPADTSVNRRVAAVLTFLRTYTPSTNG